MLQSRKDLPEPDGPARQVMRPCGMPLLKEPAMMLFTARLPVEYQNEGAEKSIVTVDIFSISFLNCLRNANPIFISL